MFQNFTGIVEFVSSDCAPCKELAPVIKDFCKNKALTLSVVDIDDEPEKATAFGIRKAPTLVYFKNGDLLDFSIGSCSSEDLEKQVTRLGLTS